MKVYKKSLIGSILTLFIGTSCCWLSSLAIWIGGVTFIGTLVNVIEDLQTVILCFSVFLFLIAIYLYFKSRKKQ